MEEKKFARQYREKAAKIPAAIRKKILEEGWIDTVINVQEENTPMEYLFNVYVEYANRIQDMEDFTCEICRGRVIYEWREMKDYLIELGNGKITN